jgi:hypothetical protein
MFLTISSQAARQPITPLLLLFAPPLASCEREVDHRAEKDEFSFKQRCEFSLDSRSPWPDRSPIDASRYCLLVVPAALRPFIRKQFACQLRIRDFGRHLLWCLRETASSGTTPPSESHVHPADSRRILGAGRDLRSRSGTVRGNGFRPLFQNEGGGARSESNNCGGISADRNRNLWPDRNDLPFHTGVHLRRPDYWHSGLRSR